MLILNIIICGLKASYSYFKLTTVLTWTNVKWSIIFSDCFFSEICDGGQHTFALHDHVGETNRILNIVFFNDE